MVVWWMIRAKPDGLLDFFRFKSVGCIIPLNDDRALLRRDKLGGSATAAAVRGAGGAAAGRAQGSTRTVGREGWEREEARGWSKKKRKLWLKWIQGLLLFARSSNTERYGS